LLAGPGAITATILLAGRAHSDVGGLGDLVELAILIAAIVAVAAASLVSFLCAEWIGGLIGVTGNIVLSRLLGVLLAALAVQYVVDGIRAVLAG